MSELDDAYAAIRANHLLMIVGDPASEEGIMSVERRAAPADQGIERWAGELRGRIRISQEAIDELLAASEIPREALNTFDGLVAVARALLDQHYPADIFNAANPIVGNDPGTKLVVALREVVEARDAR